ncbi:MAG: hypothetical protein FJ291_22080 [Planctomycetes bacterium]|nr:hypothetical protein [Planctomycetota bacterium]
MQNDDDVIAVEEARRRHAGKWLALRVVSRDANRMPANVRVVAEADTLEALCKRARPINGLYLTFAGPIVPPGWAFVFSSTGQRPGCS